MTLVTDSSLAGLPEGSPKGQAGHTKLVCSLKTKGLFSYFFRIQDTYESVSDIPSFVPYKFEEHIREGNYRRDQNIVFDHQKEIAIYDNRDTVKIVKGVRDIISALYYLRTLDLESGDTIWIEVHTYKENHTLEVRISEKGDYLVAKPILKGVKVFGSEGGLVLYYTNDEQKIPVLIKIKMVFGHIEAKLIR